MACRLVNLHKYPLSIDLRGGDTLVLAPGQTSHALLEELLYDNHRRPGWEAAGWVARLPAKFAETQPQAAGAADAADFEVEGEAEPDGDAEHDGEDDAADDTAEDSDTESPKPRRRRKHR